MNIDGPVANFAEIRPKECIRPIPPTLGIAHKFVMPWAKGKGDPKIISRTDEQLPAVLGNFRSIAESAAHAFESLPAGVFHPGLRFFTKDGGFMPGVGR